MPGSNEFAPPFGDYRLLPLEQQQIFRQRIVRRAHAEQASVIRAALASLLITPWQAATLGSRAARGLAIRVAAALIRWWRARAERRERLRGVAQLEALSDRELWDIGLRRCEIHSAVHHGRHEPPRRAPGMARTAALPVPTPARPDASAGLGADVKERKRAA